MGVKPESDMIGLNFVKNILASAIRMENETGGRKILGRVSGTCTMIEA